MSNYFLKPKPIPCSPLLLPRSARRSCRSLLGAAVLHRQLFPTDAAAALRPPHRHDRLFLPGHQGDLQHPWDQAQVARRHPWELVLSNLHHWSRRCRQLPCTRQITSSEGSDDPRRPSECPLLWSSRTTRSSRPTPPSSTPTAPSWWTTRPSTTSAEKPGHRETDVPQPDQADRPDCVLNHRLPEVRRSSTWTWLSSRPTWFPAQDPLPPGHLCPCHPHWELLLHLNLLLCNSLSTLRCYSPVGRSPARPNRTPLCSQHCWQPSLFSPPSSLELLVLNFSFPVQTLPKNFCFNPIVCNFNAQYSDKNWKVLFFPLDTTCLRQF